MELYLFDARTTTQLELENELVQIPEGNHVIIPIGNKVDLLKESRFTKSPPSASFNVTSSLETGNASNHLSTNQQEKPIPIFHRSIKKEWTN